MLCPRCGGKFFEKSLPFHLKACEARTQELYDRVVLGEDKKGFAFDQANQSFVNTGPLAPKPIPCEYCHKMFYSTTIDKHYQVQYCHKAFYSSITLRRNECYTHSFLSCDGAP